MEDSYDIIIVGAGMAGLAAAHHILTKRPSTKLLILESRDRVGGRIYSYPLDNGAVDLGASWIHGSTGNPIAELAERLGFQMKISFPSLRAFFSNGTEAPPEKVNELFFRIWGSTFEWLGDVAQGGSDEDDEIGENVSLSDRLYRKDSPLYKKDGKHKDEDDRMVESLARNLEGWTGAPLDYVSLKWWCFNQDTEGPDALLVDGYGPLVQWFKRDIERMGGKFILGEKVTKVTIQEGEDEEDEGSVLLTTEKTTRVNTDESSQQASTHKQYQTPYALLTLPLGVLKHNPPVFNPPLPLRRRQAIDRLGFGLLDKVVLVYETAWWADSEQSKALVENKRADEKEDDTEDKSDSTVKVLLVSEERPTRLMGPSGGLYPDSENIPTGAFPPRTPEYLKEHPQSLMIFDVHAQSGIPALCLFIGGERGDVLEACTDEDTKRWAVDVVNSYLGKPLFTNRGTNQVKGDVPQPKGVVMTKWRADPNAYGSYSFIPKGAIEGQTSASPLDQLELSRTLWGKIFWAGEHTEVNRYSTVHGAWTTGVREAEKILVKLNAQ
ncbi:amine oxidase [Serendipita vermifera]|nr:amine oxidase [Serendipita vermifera]